jgi:hypothetical protein
MQIQPITNQPKFSGKVVFDNGVHSSMTYYLSPQISTKFKEIATMVKEKPYDVFIFKKEQDKDFYYVAANKSMEEAKKVKEYTVKVQSSIMLESVVDAAKDAMDIYEKYISKVIKG